MCRADMCPFALDGVCDDGQSGSRGASCSVAIDGIDAAGTVATVQNSERAWLGAGSKGEMAEAGRPPPPRRGRNPVVHGEFTQAMIGELVQTSG